MKKGMGLWCLIVILTVVGSAFSGMVGAANKSAIDSAINITEETNITNATISNLNKTMLDNTSSINVSVEGADNDEDGIDDYEEQAGHISELDGKTYFTDNTSESTDRDPYDDGQEVDGHSPADLGDFGGQMPASVKAPGKHPLVPSYPDLKVELEGIEVIPKCKITSTETKEEGDSWLLTTETLDRTKTDWGVESSFSIIPFSIGFKPYYRNEHESYTYTLNSTSGWTREEWSTATAVEPDKAAKLKFHLKIKNEGTDAARGVKLTFNVKVGDKVVDTVWTGETPIAGLIGPDEIYPAHDYIVIDSDKDGHEIVITLDELKSIELGAPISIDIVEIITEVPWGKTYKDWAPYISDIEEISARIMVDFGDGEVKDYRVFSGIRHTPSPPYPYIMNISVKESINWLIGLEEREDGVYIGTAPYVNKPVKLENWTFGFDNETFHQINETLGEDWTLYDLLNVTIKQGWVIVMKAPDVKPPEIHWASYSSDMKTIKASVSDNENIGCVTAYVKVAGDYRKFNLTDENHDLIYSVTLPLVIQDIKDDYIEASDGKFTSRFDGILPPVNKSVNVTDLILEDNESHVIKNKTHEVKNVIIKDNARLTVKNATLYADAYSDFQYNIIVEDNGSLILDNGKISTNWIVTPMYCINYSLYFNETEGEGANKTVNGNISRSELVNVSGKHGVYTNYTVYIKGENFSAPTKEPSILSKATIEPKINVSQALQKYTGINVSNLTNVTINVTTTVTYIWGPCKIKLNLRDNATLATKNDAQAVIYKINSTGQPEINISESVFDYLTAINGKADVIIAKSYMGDLEKLSANSVDISDSEIKNIGLDADNYGDPGENASISIDCLDDVYISNTSLLAGGGGGKEGSDGGVNENGGNGGEGGNASISIGSDMNISIINSSLSSTGGNAGNGGDGADDVCWSCWPGNGGNGGYGGGSLISLRCKSLSVINSSTSNAGGNAGNGGNGGDAGLWGDDGDGGDGGDGGYASISFISDARESFIKNSYLSSKGGNKGYGGRGHHYGDDGYLGRSSISFTSKTLTTLDSILQSIDYNGDSKIAYMTFDCYTNLVNTTYTPFSVTSGNRANICYWLTTNVTDELGNPIENAIVKVTEDPSGIEVKTDYTDKNGISKMFLPSNITTTGSNHTAFVGNYFVQAFKNGYESDKESILFTDNLQISLRISIENQPPIASFTYSPENPVVNQTIIFDASSSYDPDGYITNYEWDFGDGNNRTGKIATYFYSSPVEYTVKLTVTDNSSLTNSTTKKIKVIEGIPNISWNITIAATNQLEPIVVGMHPNATDGYDPEYDVFAQTPVQGKVILILDDIFSKSIKKTRYYNESVSWNLSAGVPSGQTTTLSWNVPPNVNLTINEENNTLYSGVELSEGSHELLVTAELIEKESVTFSLELKPGWNMVSLPLIPDNCSVDAIFGSIPTLDTMPVVTWESPSFVPVTCIEPKIGYWVFTPADTTITVTGKAIANTTLNLNAGWNMVGTVGMENLTISDIPNQVPQRPAVTWEAPSFVKTNVIEPGKSAWMFVTTDTVVTAGDAFSTEVKAKAVPTITKIKSAMVTQATTEEWNLTISATNQLEPVTFGIHPNATNGYDEYDVFAQTPVQGKVIMILDDIYATEINRDRLTWNLSVGVPTGQTTTLTWDPSKIPTDVTLTLDGTDMKLHNSMELGEGSHLFVISGSTSEPTADFDTGQPQNPYPSIFGMHNGTIKPNQTILISKLYTYPCPGTGGHTEYARIWNNSGLDVNASWNGYVDDWHNVSFSEPFTFLPNETYNYTIRTGSYPQIHHTPALLTENGWINCTLFTDVNGKSYTNWIPAIRLE